MRRMKPHNVLISSLIAAAVCLVLAVWIGMQWGWWGLIPAALVVWFAVDAYRAWTWTNEG